jgi:hypothetical protein
VITRSDSLLFFLTSILQTFKVLRNQRAGFAKGRRILGSVSDSSSLLPLKCG